MTLGFILVCLCKLSFVHILYAYGTTREHMPRVQQRRERKFLYKLYTSNMRYLGENEQQARAGDRQADFRAGELW